MTTKAQERAALEKIRKIVAGLGENSYIGTAFDGCFEIADQNIEYDFADSFKGRLEVAEKDLEQARAETRQLRDQLAESEKDYAAAHAAAHEIAEQKDAEIAALRQRTFAPDDLTDISQILADRVLDLGKDVSNAAQRIVEQAEQPGSVEFQDAVKEHRAAQTHLSYHNALLSRVNAIKSAACAGY